MGFRLDRDCAFEDMSVKQNRDNVDLYEHSEGKVISFHAKFPFWYVVDLMSVPVQTSRASSRSLGTTLP